MKRVFLTSTEGYQPSTTSYLRVHSVAMKPLHALHCPLKVQGTSMVESCEIWKRGLPGGPYIYIPDFPFHSTTNPQDTEVLFCLLGAA